MKQTHEIVLALNPSPQPRRMPRQGRGYRRVDALLDAAAAEIGEIGYEAVTMSAVAARADACIGSLYQFFPNKLAIAQALRLRYATELERIWAPLASEAKRVTLHALIVHLVDLTVAFIDRHPAFLALLDAPSSTHAPATVRQRFRKLVAGFLLAHKPRMSRAKALRLATVTIQLFKAMNFLYRDLPPAQRRSYVQEFKMLLHCYLESRIGPDERSTRHV